MLDFYHNPNRLAWKMYALPALFSPRQPRIQDFRHRASRAGRLAFVGQEPRATTTAKSSGESTTRRKLASLLASMCKASGTGK